MYYHVVLSYMFVLLLYVDWSVTVPVRSKAWVFGRPIAGIVGSNPAGGMDVCLL